MNNRPIRFLLVEDDASHAKLIRMGLEAGGDKTVDWVDAGDKALAYIRRETGFEDRPRPDVILLDLNLPGMDGCEVLEQIKSDSELYTIPVIVLSTSPSHLDRQRAYHHRANSYIVKPVDFDKLQQMLHDVRLYWSLWNMPPT